MKAKWQSVLIFILCLCITLSGCGTVAPQQQQTVSFTDDCGRTVELPAQIDHIAVTGSLAQIIVFALAPDKLAGTAGKWSEDALPFIDEKYTALPVLGQLYGGKSELNAESLLQSGAQLVLDVGEQKDSLRQDMDELQEQTGLPVIHIDAYLATLDESYTVLGKLLGMEQEAGVLSKYCRHVYDRALAIARSVDKVNLLYLLGDDGCHVIARSSYPAEVLDLLCNNVAVLDAPSSKGIGNATDPEQIMLWNPDYIFFAPDSIYATVAQDPAWQHITAIAADHYCQVPDVPYNWMGFPPSAQRLLGMIWMAYTLYPDACDYDLYEEVSTYFRLFYHATLTQEEFQNIMENSIL